MTAWDIKTIIVGICIMTSFFLAPVAMAAGDEKATDGKGVESARTAEPTDKELQLEQRYLEEHFKVLTSELQATRERYQAVQAEIKKRAEVKKAEGKGKK